MKYGVTAEGFIMPTMQDILEDIQSRMIAKGYEEFVVDPYSVEGVLLGVVADTALQCWSGIKQAYNSRYYDLSEGMQLDRHGKNLNISRNLGKYATTTLKFTTNADVVIPKNTYVRIRDTDLNFYTVERIEILANSSGEVQAIAENTGEEYNCNTNAITEMVNGIIGVTSVTNIIPATGGAGVESDTSYREQLKSAEKARGGSNVDAIRLALTKVPLVNAALVLENIGDEIDENGIKPGYIKCFIDGIRSLKIAETIFQNKSAGIGTTGSISYKVTSASGQTPTILYEDFNKETLYIKITIQEGLIDFGSVQNEVELRVKDYVNSCNYPTPKTIVLNQIASKVYGISDSITIVDVEMGFDQMSLGTSNIEPVIGTLLIPEIQVIDGRGV